MSTAMGNWPPIPWLRISVENVQDINLNNWTIIKYRLQRPSNIMRSFTILNWVIMPRIMKICQIVFQIINKTHWSWNVNYSDLKFDEVTIKGPPSVIIWTHFIGLKYPIDDTKFFGSWFLGSREALKDLAALANGQEPLEQIFILSILGG